MLLGRRSGVKRRLHSRHPRVPRPARRGCLTIARRVAVHWQLVERERASSSALLLFARLRAARTGRARVRVMRGRGARAEPVGVGLELEIAEAGGELEVRAAHRRPHLRALRLDAARVPSAAAASRGLRWRARLRTDAVVDEAGQSVRDARSRQNARLRRRVRTRSQRRGLVAPRREREPNTPRVLLEEGARAVLQRREKRAAAGRRSPCSRRAIREWLCRVETDCRPEHRKQRADAERCHQPLRALQLLRRVCCRAAREVSAAIECAAGELAIRRVGRVGTRSAVCLELHLVLHVGRVRVGARAYAVARLEQAAREFDELGARLQRHKLTQTGERQTDTTSVRVY